MSLFEELKRRNVFRVGIAYGVVAWLVLQVADVMIDNIGAPDWLFAGILMVLALGFPMALVIAWAFELTPEGLKRDHEVDRSRSVAAQTGRKLDRAIIVVLALAVGYLLLDRLVLQDGDPSAGARGSGVEIAERGDDAAPATASVAVLPFANMSADPDNEYFSDGISEELLNLLVKVEGLRVPSRTSSFAFKGQNRDIRDIAEQLEVGHILEGSVRKAGNQVRITAQLIDVATDTHLWSETFDRELDDIFAIQDEIASQIVTALQGVLGTTVPHAWPTENMEAYNLYLQGLYLFQQRGNSLTEAERLLRLAVEADPDFVEAWATLGLTLIMQPNYENRPLEEAVPLALQAAERADRLRPDMAEVLMVRANAASKSGRYGEAMEHHQRSVELHPDHSLAQLWFAITLLNGGYLAESERHLRLAQSLDPASGLILDWLGRVQTMLGKKTEGRANLERALQFNRSQATWGLGILAFEGLVAPDRFMEVAAGFNSVFVESARLSVPVNAGELTVQEAEDRLASMMVAEAQLTYARFVLYSFTGEQAGMAELMPVIWPRDTTALSTLWYEPFIRFRNAPEVKRELSSIGMVDLWRERGWPDLCRPVGDDDYECD